MKSQVMKTAWVIAKEMAVELGGTSKQHLSAAMKAAWAAVKNEEVAAVEVTPVVEVVEVAPVVVEEVKVATPKAPKKKKKSTGGIDFVKYMDGNSAGRTKGEKITRKPFETAAEKRKRRAANPDVYAPVKVAPKAKKNGVGVDFGAWMDGVTSSGYTGR